MAWLERIQIKGFKSIREMDLELHSLNILIGANGAGKSNLIEAFRLVYEIFHKRLQEYVIKAGGADRLLHFGRKRTGELSIKLFFERDSYEIALKPTDAGSLFFVREIWGNQIYSSHLETFIHDYIWQELSEENKIAVNNLSGLRIYHFHDTSPEARVKQPGYIGDNAFLHSDAGNLAAYLYMLREVHPEHYRQIIKTIRLAAPFFDDFYLHPISENTDNIRLEWREKGWDAVLPVSYLSDGTLRFMCLTTLLLQPEPPATILIDEPELGLHPYAIGVLAAMLQSIAAERQVIVTTQSVSLVNQFTPEDIVVVEHMEGQSTFRRLDEKAIETWLDEYGMGDLWEKNVIGGSP